MWCWHYRIHNDDGSGKTATAVTLTEVLPANSVYVWESAKVQGKPARPRGVGTLALDLGDIAHGAWVQVEYSLADKPAESAEGMGE